MERKEGFEVSKMPDFDGSREMERLSEAEYLQERWNRENNNMYFRCNFVKSKMLDGKDEHFTVAHSCSWCLLKEINDTLKWFIGAESHQAD